MASKYQVIWSQEAEKNFEEIISWIGMKRSAREVENFKRDISLRINLVRHFPRLAPKASHDPEIRRSVVSKQTSIIYKLKGNTIYIIYIFDNRQDPEKFS